MTQKGLSSILVIVFILIALITLAIYYFNNLGKEGEIKQENYRLMQQADSGKSEQNQNSSPTTSLANPASENCIKEGGSLSIQTRGDGGQYGVCEFEDDKACEEWALMRGQCPVGGVKTIGFDTPAQIYCALVGGQTLAVENAKCTLPGGKVCPAQALFNGQCDE